MAIVTKSGTRHFLIQRDDREAVKNPDGTEAKRKHAVLSFNDASPKEVGAYHAAILAAMKGNKGADLDDARDAAVKAVVEEFAIARIVAAPGFEVEEDGKRRDLSWEHDRDTILASIPDPLWDLFKRTVETLTSPPTPAHFANASAMASRTFPN